jgi:hypothetical protein
MFLPPVLSRSGPQSNGMTVDQAFTGLIGLCSTGAATLAADAATALTPTPLGAGKPVLTVTALGTGECTPGCAGTVVTPRLVGIVWGISDRAASHRARAIQGVGNLTYYGPGESGIS